VCTGCGAYIQVKNPDLPGYVPSDLLALAIKQSREKEKEMREGGGEEEEEEGPLSMEGLGEEGELEETPFDLIRKGMKQRSGKKDRQYVLELPHSPASPTPSSSSSSSSTRKRDLLVCRRCFRLKHYNELIPQSTPTLEEATSHLHTLARHPSLIVKIVDIFDVSGSFFDLPIPREGDHKVLLVGNKVDLLPIRHTQMVGKGPKSPLLEKVRVWLKHYASSKVTLLSLSFSFSLLLSLVRSKSLFLSLSAPPCRFTYLSPSSFPCRASMLRRCCWLPGRLTTAFMRLSTLLCL
jgi:hypothetical protein